MTNKEIGLRIAHTRNELGLTMDDVAKKVGVAKSTIQRYEKGTIKKLKLPVIESIAYVLNVDPNWIIGNTESKEPKVRKEQPTGIDELSTDEINLIMLFRKLPADTRASYPALLEATLKAQGLL